MYDIHGYRLNMNLYNHHATDYAYKFNTTNYFKVLLFQFPDSVIITSQ